MPISNDMQLQYIYKSYQCADHGLEVLHKAQLVCRDDTLMFKIKMMQSMHARSNGLQDLRKQLCERVVFVAISRRSHICVSGSNIARRAIVCVIHIYLDQLAWSTLITLYMRDVRCEVCVLRLYDF